MDLYCVGARRAVPLHGEAATVSLTETMIMTVMRTSDYYKDGVICRVSFLYPTYDRVFKIC